MVYKCFDKMSAGSGVANNEIKQNLQLAGKLQTNLAKSTISGRITQTNY